ncbi:MAG: hypothetical protein ACOVK2_02890 [Candidatus Fonsibacter sp.]
MEKRECSYTHENRSCNFRKCNNDISEKRIDAKFCCRNCKNMERTYVKRKELLLKKYAESEMVKVNNYKNLVLSIKSN